MFKSTLIDNEFSHYRKFSYHSLPIGFGESSKENVYEDNTNHKLTPYERNKLWRKINPEKYREQIQLKYILRKIN